MNIQSLIKKITALSVAAVVVTTFPATAMAAVAGATEIARTPRTSNSGPLATQSLDQAKSRAHTAIKRRLTRLDALRKALEKSKRLTAEHRGALETTIADTRQGLADLDAKIQADTDIVTLRADVVKIAEDYRVFVLLSPKVRIVIAGDKTLAAVAKLQATLPRLQEAIDNKKAQGVDVTAAQAALDAMPAKIASARSKATGIADTVIAVEANGWPANQPTLKSSRDTLKSARKELRAARADAKTVIASLKS